jgi:hypothetical protein
MAILVLSLSRRLIHLDERAVSASLLTPRHEVSARCCSADKDPFEAAFAVNWEQPLAKTDDLRIERELGYEKAIGAVARHGGLRGALGRFMGRKCQVQEIAHSMI